MMFFYIAIVLLIICVLILSYTLYYFIKNSTYFSNKEKEFIVFVIDIFAQYGDELGVQSKEQHEKLVEELDKIKIKHLKNEK